MKPIQNPTTSNSLFHVIFLISILVTSSLGAQNIEIKTSTSKEDNSTDSSTALPLVAHHPNSGTNKKQPGHVTKETSATSVTHSALSTHKVFHHITPATLSPEGLAIGHTYNRYGEKAYPKGYGIQVMTFKKIKNLQRFLHTYHKKDMYIQVVQFDPMQERMYRVILGAEENKTLVEQEISVFQHAGVHAVVRKHKIISE
jgi:hypothetical protein